MFQSHCIILFYLFIFLFFQIDQRCWIMVEFLIFKLIFRIEIRNKKWKKKKKKLGVPHRASNIFNIEKCLFLMKIFGYLIWKSYMLIWEKNFAIKFVYWFLFSSLLFFSYWDKTQIFSFMYINIKKGFQRSATWKLQELNFLR